MDTIYALSSGALPSGVAVIRISGPQAETVLRSLASRNPAPRKAILDSIRSRNGSLIDRGLVLWFPGPASFTGEDSVELHLHGGRAVVDRMLLELSEFEGVRLAEAGEFSRRAFINGKLDLTEAEGLADLIASETEAQRVLALSQASGALKTLYDGWQARLLHARAMIEAEIDFVDEEDVPGSVADQVWFDMSALGQELRGHIDGARRAEAVREGFRIALVGAPNAGKSSLINALAGSEVAIVSSQPGTTRDVVETRLSLGGRLVVIADTAGLRDTSDFIEAEGVKRALERARDADLVLHLSDDGHWEDLPDTTGSAVWRIASKCDLGDSGGSSDVISVTVNQPNGLSALIDSLQKHLRDVLGKDVTGLPTRQRHLDRLKRALVEIDAAVAQEQLALELRAEYLRAAAFNLGCITGQHDVEDMLGVIFSEFCIGK